MSEDKSSESGWGELATEARHPLSMELDLADTEEIVALLLEEDRRGLRAASQQGKSIAVVAEWVAEALVSGGRLVFAGAGTSGRLGVIEAAECPPTFGTQPEDIQAVIAGGPEAVFAAREGAEDDREAGHEYGASLQPEDVLIGLSASSVTPYVLGAIEAAGGVGARTVLISCAPRRRVAVDADLVICLDTGPEILTGSTRLKAGSATKAVLNAITTSAMVRLGKVYENMMVDLRIGSQKLRDRAVRIVATLAELEEEQAQEILQRADGEVKVAVVMGRRQLDPSAARELLEHHDGRLRNALED